jgi:enolase
MSKKIKSIEALEILDSRGDPTVEVTVELENGMRGTASVPSGASTGAYEAFELRDKDPKRYAGKGVLHAVMNVNTEIAKHLHGMYVNDQERLDKLMLDLDGTSNKQRLGANAILGVSLACARAAAMAFDIPLYQYIRSLTTVADKLYKLPTPCINVINGGMHADTNLEIQEFWIIPHKAETFADRLRQGSEIFHQLGEVLKAENLDTDLGNEGGYAPNFPNHRQVFDMLMRAIEQASYTPGEDISLGIDAGSTVFYDTEKKIYALKLEHEEYTADALAEYYKRLLKQYPIAAMEDPFAEEDWTSWQKFTALCKAQYPDLKLVGDDLFVTNSKRLQKGIDMGVANSILIKVNQIGTLTETLQCIALAQANGYSTVISHRSGETSDTFIADLAVAVNADYIKTGSTARGERIAKYNRLLEIEKELHAGK